jgi:hypothetical protein
MRQKSFLDIFFRFNDGANGSLSRSDGSRSVVGH